MRAGGGPGPVAGMLLPGRRLWGASILFCLLYAGVGAVYLKDKERLGSENIDSIVACGDKI